MYLDYDYDYDNTTSGDFNYHYDYNHNHNLLNYEHGYYSLGSELLVAEMNVSRCILVLDTSISAMSNLEGREYLTALGRDWGGQTRRKLLPSVHFCAE